MSYQVEATRKQVLAAQYFHQGMSKLAALAAAGYADPANSVTEVFDSKGVKAELEKLQAEARKRHDIQVDDVIDGLMEALPMATTATELVMIWREIGKIIGAYTQTIEVDIKKRVEHIHSVKQLEVLSDKDLAELAQLGDDFVLDAEYEVVDDVG